MHNFHEKCYSTGNFLGKTNSPNITVVDTPGFKVGFLKSNLALGCQKAFDTKSEWLQDQRDTEFVEELMNVLGDEVKQIKSFGKQIMCTKKHIHIKYRSKRSRAL